MINYHNRRFKVMSNSDNGELDTSLIFRYEQYGKILLCRYSGGAVVQGQILGSVSPECIISLVYQQVNTGGDIKTGKCTSIPEILEDGRIRLKESWQWTNGDLSKGESVLEELLEEEN